MIVREPRGAPGFVKIPNRTARNRKISFRALGILTHVLSMPDNWSCTTDELADLALEGRDAIRTAIRELETHGYVVRTKTRNEAGQWVHNQVFRERAVARPAPDIQSSEPPAEMQESAAHPDDWKPDVGRSGVREKTQRKRRPKEDQTPVDSTPSAPADGGQLFDVEPSTGRRLVGLEPGVKAIADEIWNSWNPKPSTPYVGLLQIIRKLRVLGWSDDDIKTYGKTTATLSLKAMEVARNTAKTARSRRVNPDDNARDFLARNTTRYAGRTQEPPRHA